MNEVPVASLAAEVWARRRRRAGQLVERHAFAAELLRLYGALLDVQESAFLKVLDDRPDPARVAAYAADGIVEAIADATVKAGPAALAAAVRQRLRDGEPAGFVARWLAGERQEPVAEYLARAAAAPVLEALGPAAGRACSGRTAEGGCPRCGGLPQLSYLAESPEALVSAPRLLLCCRCGDSWVHQRMTCVGCGEQATAKLPIFADAERFPHLRADACETCRRYLITIDLRREPHAVPVVDELSALPLDLYAKERGFSKIVPNLMAIG
ncbi:MAG TPA: formate dehydrogenase accessory protein FdhE [Methylomirabilota bacterium]|nr:formate dehydrogenase accessory protein FdhE [Methylomirabilota bacterium]